MGGHSCTAATSPALRLIREVAALAEVPAAETFDFFAHGMLLNVIAALDMPGGEVEDWGAC